MAAEGRFDDVGGIGEQVRVRFGQQRRRVGVQLVVAEETEDRAVKSLVPDFRNDRQQRASRPAIRRREALRRKRELLDALHREVLQDAADGVVLVVAAINRDVDVSSGRAADREGAYARFRRVERRLQRRARNQNRQRSERATIDRQVFQTALIDNAAHIGLGRLNQRR